MSNIINKTAQLFDESEGTWHDVYEAPGAEGRRISIIVPRDIRDAGLLRRALLRGGANVAPLNQSRGALIAAGEADAPVVRQAGATGWRDEHSRFVTHRHVVGGKDKAVRPPPPHLLKAAGDLNVRGTLGGWQDLIEIACFSTAMIIALCAVFAAPLLCLLNMPNFGLVLVGPSRSGKSTAQLVGASAMGFGREEHLPTLNATPAGLSEAARVFNDHMLPINEVGTARGPKTDIHLVMHDATYAITSGRDVMRHSSWGGAAATTSSFHGLLLMSSEFSPDEWAARGGEARDPGETARLIGVPVLYGENTSVFDVFPKVVLKDREDWVRSMFERIRNGLPAHCGVAFQTYIEALLSDLPNHVNNAKEDAIVFRAAASKYVRTPIERDIAAKFAVLYAGGMAAIDAGVLPLAEDRVFRALLKACKASLTSMPDSNADLKFDLHKLLEILRSGGVVNADNLTDKLKKLLLLKADGYHIKEGIGRLYTLRSDGFADLFPSALRARKILEWLDDQGFLRHSRDRKPDISNVWAQTTKTWPDETRHRSFCIYFPSGLDVLNLEA